MLHLPQDMKSYWREAYQQPLYPELANNIEVDVVIVGAGITGLTTAYLLIQAGLKVAVIEKDTVGGGTTGRTTGKVTSQHNLIYNDFKTRLGTKTAQIYAEANQAAVEKVHSIIKQEKIDCDWQWEDNYVYTTDKNKVKQFEQEAATAASLGLPATFETTTPLPFEIQAAVKFSGQGKFHSQKYLSALAAKINSSGSYVFEHSNVIGIRDGSPGRVRTKKASVTAKDIVIATSVPTLPLVARGGFCLLEYPTESYIVAGKPQVEISGMYISPDKQHYSLLPVLVGNDKLLLIGGESHISGLRGNKQARYQRLADYGEKHFGMTAVTHRWSDRDYLTYDGVPLIGKLYPWSRHLYVGTAYRKWGLSNGTAAGMILSDLITNSENKWADTFRPSRLSPIASIPRTIAKHISGN